MQANILMMLVFLYTHNQLLMVHRLHNNVQNLSPIWLILMRELLLAQQKELLYLQQIKQLAK